MSNKPETREYLEPRDEVQVFRLGSLPKGSADAEGLVVANSSNSRISMFELQSGESSAELRAQPDCEQILFVLEGECSLACDAGEFRLSKDQGFLVRADARYAVSNPGTARTALLLMRTTAPAEAHAANVPSDFRVKLPMKDLSASGIRNHFEVYALSRHEIGVSFFLMKDWNEASLTRMNALWEVEGDDLWVTIPQRFAQWYGLQRLEEGDYRYVPDVSETTRGRVELIR